MRCMMSSNITIIMTTAWLAQAEAATNRAGAITKFDGVDEIVQVCTTSTTFVNMPAMNRTFTQGGTGSDEVIAQFQASASLSGEDFDTGFVQLQVGSTVQSPGGNTSDQCQQPGCAWLHLADSAGRG
jgi:hypothetical protein